MGHRIPRLGWIRLLGGVSGVGPISWLLLDRYITNLAAGSVDSTAAEPGPGTRTVTDTGNNAAIVSSELKVTAIVGARDPWLRYAGGISRAAGVMHRFDASADGIAVDNWLVGLATTLTTPGIAETLGVVFGATTIKAQPADTQIADYTLATDTTLQTILRSTGFFVMIGGVLHHISRAGTTAALYAHAAGLVADVAVDCRVDDFGVILLSTADPALFPTPTLSDTFSDVSAPYVSDGLAHIEADGNGSGVTWDDTSAQWSNNSNKAYIDADAVAGAELLTNGDFANWTGDDPDSWTVLGEVGADPEVSEVGTGEGHGGVGTGMCNIYTSAGANVSVTQSVATAKEWFRLSVDVDTIVGGAPRWFIGRNVTWGGTGTYVATSRATEAPVYLGVLGAGSDITFDNASVKLLAFEDLLRAAAPTDSDEPFFAAALTITDDTQAGLVINLDDYATPADCIHIWCDRVDSKIYARELVAGVWQADALAGVAFTYSAGTLLEVRRIGNDVYVFYNSVYIGNFTTVVPDTDELVALFMTENNSFVETVENYPTNVYDYSAYV